MPAMVKRRNGKVIIINSVLGKIGMATRTIYTASKFALGGYFDSLRAEVFIFLLCINF